LLTIFLTQEDIFLVGAMAASGSTRVSDKKVVMAAIKVAGMLSLDVPLSDMTTRVVCCPFLISSFSERDLPVREYWAKSWSRVDLRMTSTTDLRVTVPWLANPMALVMAL